jgi:predicted MFS family arabinose efflux permease
MKRGLGFSLAVLFGINILNFYDRHVPGALTEPMRKEFNLSDAQIGLLGSAFIWIYAFVGVPLGRVADVWSRKKLLAWGTAVWSIMTAYSGVAGSYFTLMVSRLGVGVGEAVCAPTGTSWIGDLFPAHRRSRALALFMLGVPIGGALSYFFAGAIAHAWGWRIAMVTAALPAALLIPALLALHEPQRGATESHAHAVSGSMWGVLKIPTLWWIIASGALINFNMYAIGTFLPAMLGRIHHLSVREAGLATGVAFLVGGLCGGTLSGWIGDRIVHRRGDGRMLAASILALSVVPFSYIGIIQPAGAVVFAVAMLTLAYGGLNTYYGLVYSSIQDIVAPAQRGTTMAVYFFAMYMMGASFGPILTGRLSDMLARRAADAAGSVTITEAFRAVGLQQAMLVIPVLSFGLALVLWAGSRTIVADIARRDRKLSAVGV